MAETRERAGAGRRPARGCRAIALIVVGGARRAGRESAGGARSTARRRSPRWSRSRPASSRQSSRQSELATPARSTLDSRSWPTPAQQLAETEEANGKLDEVEAKLGEGHRQPERPLGRPRRARAGGRQASTRPLAERTAELDALEKQDGRCRQHAEPPARRRWASASASRSTSTGRSTALRGNRAASEEELAAIQSEIGERLKVLGEREQALAEYETKARLAAYRLEQLQAEAAAVEPRLAAMKGELGQVDIEVAERQRAIDDSYGKVARAKAALAEIRQLVAQ